MVESSQSNFTPVVLERGGDLPLREAMRTWLPFEESRGAMRLDILPVPPVKRMVPTEDIVERGWKSELLQEGSCGADCLLFQFIKPKCSSTRFPNPKDRGNSKSL